MAADDVLAVDESGQLRVSAAGERLAEGWSAVAQLQQHGGQLWLVEPELRRASELHEMPTAVRVSSVADDGTAAGLLLGGDYVLAIDGTTVDEHEHASALLRAAVGEILLSILRDGTPSEVMLFKPEQATRNGLVLMTAAAPDHAPPAPPPDDALAPPAAEAAEAVKGDATSDAPVAAPVAAPAAAVAPPPAPPAAHEMCIRLRDLSESRPLPMGASFELGGCRYRLSRPELSSRRREAWARLACSLGSSVGAVREFLLLPQWTWCNYGYIGRRHKHATLPLRDLKARRRHARLVLRDFTSSDSTISAGAFRVMPHKGKPCQLMLGREGQQLRAPLRLQAGDVFCVGQTHARVAALTAVQGGRLVLCQDKGKRYRRKALKEEKRQRKLLGKDDSSSDDDEAKLSSEGEEGELPLAPFPFVKLELVAGPLRGRWLELGGGGCCIGSSARCALTLRNDRTVSPLHARINCVRGAWYLADCASSAGTFLLIPDAGSRVDIGDVVRIGKTEINFFVQVEQEPPA